MKKIIFLVILLSNALLSQDEIDILFDDVIQNALNFNLNGNGARAAGLGYSFTGIADDASAISWNPAGLTQLYQMEASIVGRLGAGTGSVEGFSDIGVNSWDIDVKSKFQLNFLSIVVPFSIGDFNIVGGLAYRRMYDFSRETTSTIETDGMFLGFFDQTQTDRISGGINAISPSLGIQLSDMFSIGATVNILSGTEEGTRDFDKDGFSEELFNYEIEYSGVAIDLGVLFKPTENLSFGANLNLPHTRTYKFKNLQIINTMYGGFQSVDLEAPLFFRAGVGFRANDNLLFAFDYSNRPASKVVWKLKEFGERDKEIGGEDLNSIHFGAEYLITSGNSVIPVRLGFYTDPSNAVDDSGEQIVTKVLTAGIGIILGNVVLDGSFEWGKTESVENEDFDITFKGNGFLMSLGAVIHFGGDE